MWSPSPLASPFPQVQQYPCQDQQSGLLPTLGLCSAEGQGEGKEDDWKEEKIGDWRDVGKNNLSDIVQVQLLVVVALFDR